MTKGPGWPSCLKHEARINQRVCLAHAVVCEKGSEGVKGGKGDLYRIHLGYSYYMMMMMMK